MPAEILIVFRERDFWDLEILLVLAILALIGVALYSTWPEWRK